MATGWAIPSAINLLLAAWCALAVTAVLWMRCAAVAVFSFVLGINGALPALVARVFHSPEVITEIQRPIALDAGKQVDLWMRPRVPVAANPLSAPISVGADEGCMCSYFVQNPAASYFERIADIARSSGRFPAGMRAGNYSAFPDQLARGVHFDINFATEQPGASTVDLVFDLYDGAERRARLIQRGIPYDPGLGARFGRERRLLNGYFLENCMAMLLHDNFWTWLLRDRAAYLPRSTIEDFLASAIHLS